MKAARSVLGVIGAGKFGSMFPSLVRTPHAVNAPLRHRRSLDSLRPRRADGDQAGTRTRLIASSFDEALRTGRTMLTEDANALIAADGLDVVVEVTGSPGRRRRPGAEGHRGPESTSSW